MFWLFCVSCIVFTTYTLYIVCNNTPESLSDTYYILQQKKLGWLFQFVIITTSISIFPVWLHLSLSNIQFLPFLACSGLIFVGVAPAFKLELDGIVHLTSAIISGLSAIIWMICSGFWYVVIFGILIACLISLQYKNLLFWLEIMGFICIYLSIVLL